MFNFYRAMLRRA